MSAPIPRPGEHLPGPAPTVDPDVVAATVDRLLSDVDAVVTDDSADGLVAMNRQARILEQAHHVLVDALAAVDTN